jgi:hypothetical protein
MKITVQKQDDAYLPYDDEAVEFTKRKKENALFVIDVKEQRNPKFHGFAMLMLHTLYDMVDTDLMFDPWRKMLTIKAGYFTTIGKVDIKGTTSVAVEAKSLSFASMNDAEFKQCFSALVRVFIDKYGNIITFEELEKVCAM